MLEEGNVILAWGLGSDLIQIENIGYRMVHPPTLYGHKLQFLGNFEFINNALHLILKDDIFAYFAGSGNVAKHCHLVLDYLSLRDQLWYLLIRDSDKICFLSEQNKLLSLVYKFGVTFVFDNEIFAYETLLGRDIVAMGKLLDLIND